MQKIVHVIPTLSLGGAERLVVDLSTHMDRAQFQTQVAVLSRGGSLQSVLDVAQIPVHAFPIESVFKWRTIVALSAFLSMQKPDVVHTHLWGGDFYGILAARRAKVPYCVSTLHNTHVDEPWARSRMRRWALAKADRAVCLSQAIADFAQEKYHIPAEKLQVIHNGVDVHRFSSKLKIKSEKLEFVFGTVARLERQKGIDILLRAFAQFVEKKEDKRPQKIIVRRARPKLERIPAKLLIVGEGAERAHLGALAHHLRISDLVTFVPATLRVEEKMAKMDCFVLPSRWEGFGIVLIEAMASGLPIVASNVGGIPEIVREGETGLLTPPEDVGALSAALEYMDRNRAEACRLGEQGRQRVEEYFRIEKTVEEYEKLYMNV